MLITRRPLSGGIKPEIAINDLRDYEVKLERLISDHDLLCRAKEALVLDYTRDDRLSPILEELRDLQGVWIALSGIWGRLDLLRGTAWSMIQVSCKLAIVSYCGLSPSSLGSYDKT